MRQHQQQRMLSLSSGDSPYKAMAQQLLKAVGSKQEMDQYIELYSGAEQFALIKVGGDCIAHQLDELSPALSFLHHVGLHPIVVHGAGPQMNKLLEEQNVSTHKQAGNLKVALCAY